MNKSINNNKTDGNEVNITITEEINKYSGNSSVKRILNQVARGGTIYCIESLKHPENPVQLSDSYHYFFQQKSFIESRKSKLERDRSVNFYSHEQFRFVSIDFLKENMQVIYPQDLILHDLPLNHSGARYIRELNCVVIHPNPDAVRFGAAEHLWKAGDFEKLEAALKKITNNFERKEYSFKLNQNRLPALYLDRDGVLIVDTHYPKKANAVKLIDEILPLLKFYQGKGWLLIVVTNQSGIGRDYYTAKEMTLVNREMRKLLAQEEVYIDSIYHSPYYINTTQLHYYQLPQYRKPSPGLFFRAEEDFGIDLGKSVMVGNKATDILAGYWAGIEKLYLFNPLDEKESEDLDEAKKLLNFEYKYLNSQLITDIISLKE